MAAKKSAQYPYQWPDGTWHSKSWTAEQIARAGTPPQTTFSPPTAPTVVGAPPKGSANPAQPAAMPVDPNAELQRIGAGRNVALSNAEAAYQTGQASTSYGYKLDPATGKYVVDASNPYSEAMRLQDTYKSNQLGTNNSMAAAGQLYSGARLNQQGINDRQYAQADYGLRQGFANTLHGIQFGQGQTYAANAGAVSDADFQNLLNALGVG